MNKKVLLATLQAYKSDSVFNPYSDNCDLSDRSNAAKIRLDNLSDLIDSFLGCPVDAIWVGRDLGHKGGRRTGIAFTDEFHLELASKVWGVNLGKATKDAIVTERTATTIWNLIDKIDKKIFTWNIFPFHPYEKHNHRSNRSHTVKERSAGKKIISMLVELMCPKTMVAVGNDAYNCLQRMFPDTEVFKVRHPSYGGEKMFSQQISELYSL